MRILSCNVGSTSLKFRLYAFEDRAERELAQGAFSGIGRPQGEGRMVCGETVEQESSPRADYAGAISAMLRFLNAQGVLPGGQLDCVAFKVVAALAVTGVVRLTEEVLAAMAAYNTLLPAHNPPYIAAIRQFMETMPGVPLVGSFETGFFEGMPKKAYAYALPAELMDKGVRRNGAHGASHEYVSQWVVKREGRQDVKLISCHLGGSSSIAAVQDGRGVDTTLGLSLQSGLPHNNRAGDLDPYLAFYLTESLGYTTFEVKRLYEKEGGLLGLSGVSGDLRLIEAAADAGNASAQLALDVYCYQIKKAIGAFAAALSGLDAIAFAGGIGEHSARVRKEALNGLDFLGVRLDETKNALSPKNSLISAPDSRVRVYLVATNEEIIIARKARDLLAKKAKSAGI